MRPNEQARALTIRAGTAAVAVAVDTRPKIIRAKRGRGSYDRKRVARLHD
ncbi:MAG TPA: hypothetical protein P5256_09655 [Beijerinckiaceae bacterium]|jgi:stalled ribosome alternative rescue factor ArfA|nr:hypothetical protein [Hyphomicrobiales bacterium]HRY03383.1 hypothetical protein [Beijerinckiaceae bacterium]